MAPRSNSLTVAVINTVHWRRSTSPIDDLTDYRTALHLFAARGLRREVVGLEAVALDDPPAAELALHDLVRWREIVYDLFEAREARRQARRRHLRDLIKLSANVYAERRLDQTPSGYRLSWTSTHDLRLPLWLFAAASVDLLTSELSQRVKLCPGSGCGWIFVDETPNAARLWCSSATCGNRARARRHYAKRQQA